MLCACSRYEHQRQLVRSGDWWWWLWWGRAEDIALLLLTYHTAVVSLAHSFATATAEPQHSSRLSRGACAGSAPCTGARIPRCGSRAWYALSAHYSSLLSPATPTPCAHPADTLQHKLRFGDPWERHNRLSLLHQAPCSCQPCSDRPGSVHWACVRCVLSDLLLHMPRSHLGSPAGSCPCTAGGNLQQMSPHGAQSPPTERPEVPLPHAHSPLLCGQAVCLCCNNGPGNPLL
jgi:hypothetical protein